MSNREIEREATKQRIIDKASELFVEHGCKKITMDYIAVTMHISKRTIYELFEDKEALLIQCVRQLVHQSDDRWDIIKQKAKEPMVVIMLMMHSISSFIANYAKLIDDIDHYYPSIRKIVFKERPIHNEDFIKQQLTEAKSRGIIREMVNINIATNLLIRLSMLVNTLKDYDAAARSYIVSELTFTYIRGMMSIDAIQDYNSKEEEFNEIIQSTEPSQVNYDKINTNHIKLNIQLENQNEK